MTGMIDVQKRMGFVIKLVHENTDIVTRWVRAGTNRGLDSRENATVFLTYGAAEAEAKLWAQITPETFAVVIDRN